MAGFWTFAQANPGVALGMVVAVAIAAATIIVGVAQAAAGKCDKQ